MLFCFVFQVQLLDYYIIPLALKTEEQNLGQPQKITRCGKHTDYGEKNGADTPLSSKIIVSTLFMQFSF